MVEEIWKNVPIEGYENYYKISNLGNVKGYKNPNKLLSPSIGTSGYLGFSMSVNKKHKSLFIHRMVAISFIDNPLNLPEVNHKDGNKLNNFYLNLEWVTSKDNMKHAISNKLRNDFGSNSVNSKLKEEDILNIRELAKTENFNYKEIAAKYNIHKDYVTLIVNRKRWAHI